MRWEYMLSIVVVGLAGCAGNRSEPWSKPIPEKTSPKPSTVIVTPSQTRAGKVTSVNRSVHYVVITYPVGVPLPEADRRLNVYRAGLKVAEVKVGTQQKDVNTIADIMAGECQIGDEVREN